jgi:hypothetical protein
MPMIVVHRAHRAAGGQVGVGEEAALRGGPSSPPLHFSVINGRIA